ncbi:hypothetical protein HY995_04035 [Candidatus Micrarchaeota archaeon]|nr:hypothetical protein [Candidatus Micrarchaeota archaeon]MBI5177227.1 hypothetical protein [Candidatus Micrarchaeota archaeon]
MAVEFTKELTDKIRPEHIPEIERGLEDYGEQEGAGVGMPPLIHAILHARKLGMEIRGIQSGSCMRKMDYLQAAILNSRQKASEAKTAQDSQRASLQAEAHEKKLGRLRGIYHDSIVRRIGKAQPDVVILLGNTHQAVTPRLGKYRRVSIE